MWWKKKKNLDSEEYLTLRKQILDLQLDVEQLQGRFRKKIKPKSVTEEEVVTPPFDDGFNELRKLNKEQNP